jgi:hypothetical protein
LRQFEKWQLVLTTAAAPATVAAEVGREKKKKEKGNRQVSGVGRRGGKREEKNEKRTKRGVLGMTLGQLPLSADRESAPARRVSKQARTQPKMKPKKWEKARYVPSKV